jgi:hypothetical protein
MIKFYMVAPWSLPPPPSCDTPHAVAKSRNVNASVSDSSDVSDCLCLQKKESGMMGNRCSYDNVANYFPINIIELEIKILTIRQLIMTVLVFELL